MIEGDKWGRHHAEWGTGARQGRGRYRPDRGTGTPRKELQTLASRALAVAGMVQVPKIGEGAAFAKISRTFVSQTRSEGAKNQRDAALRDVVADLQRQVQELRDEIAAMKVAAAPKDALELPAEEIYQLVAAYYDGHRGEPLYPSDVADALNLDAFAVFQATNRLVREGLLE